LNKIRTKQKHLRLQVRGYIQRRDINVQLLSGREIDCSGKGMFSSQDRAYVVGQYVPKYGPELVSHAFVAGFQVH
jgi:hypothetical protein